MDRHLQSQGTLDRDADGLSSSHALRWAITQLGDGGDTALASTNMVSRAMRCRCINGDPNVMDLLVVRQPVEFFNKSKVWVSIVVSGLVGWSLFTLARWYNAGCVLIRMFGSIGYSFGASRGGVMCALH